MQNKQCIFCHKRKPLDYFYRTKRNKVGAWCLQCDSQGGFGCWMWNSNTPNEVHRYSGLTVELLKYLRSFEHKGCFICGRQNENGRKLYIDHDHATGKVRGLLCHACNVKLGKVRDNPHEGTKFHQYLQKHQKSSTARRCNEELYKQSSLY